MPAELLVLLLDIALVQSSSSTLAGTLSSLCLWSSWSALAVAVGGADWWVGLGAATSPLKISSALLSALCCHHCLWLGTVNCIVSALLLNSL